MVKKNGKKEEKKISGGLVPIRAKANLRATGHDGTLYDFAKGETKVVPPETAEKLIKEQGGKFFEKANGGE